MKTLAQFIKEGMSVSDIFSGSHSWIESYSSELTGDPVEDGYVIMANIRNKDRKENKLFEPEFKNGVLTVKIIGTQYGNETFDLYYLGYGNYFERFNEAIKAFGVKKIVLIKKCAQLEQVNLAGVVDGLEIDAPKINICLCEGGTKVQMGTITNSTIKCANFFVGDGVKKIKMENSKIECADGVFRWDDCSGFSSISPSSMIKADRMFVIDPYATLKKKLEDMYYAKGTDPDAYANLSIEKILGLKANHTLNKIAIYLSTVDDLRTATFIRKGGSFIAGYSTEYHLKDGWSLAFTGEGSISAHKELEGHLE